MFVLVESAFTIVVVIVGRALALFTIGGLVDADDSVVDDVFVCDDDVVSGVVVVVVWWFRTNIFAAESVLRGGRRSFTLSRLLASSNEIFFWSRLSEPIITLAVGCCWHYFDDLFFVKKL